MYETSILFLTISLITIILFRKRLNLLRVKWVYGEYSFDYISLFKIYTNSNPHPYCFKEEILQHIINFKKSSELKNESEDNITQSIISIPFDIKAKDLISTRGEPICFKAFRDSYYDFKIFGFPDSTFNVKSNLAYYFYKDDLFAMDYIFEDFPQSKQTQLIENINGVLNLRLANEKSKTFYLKNNCRILFTNTGFRVSLKIYKPTNEVFSKVISVFEDQQADFKGQIQNHFFSKPSN